MRVSERERGPSLKRMDEAWMDGRGDFKRKKGHTLPLTSSMNLST